MTRGQHYERVEVRRFRGLLDVDLNELGRVNILLGANDVGKTSVLEAIFLLTGLTNLQLPLAVQDWRNLPTKQFDDLRLLFHGFDPDRPIDLVGRSLGDIVCRQLTISAPRSEFEINANLPSRANAGNGASRTRQHPGPGANQASSVVPPDQRMLQYEGTIQPRQGDALSYSGTLRADDDTIKITNFDQIANELMLSARYLNSGPGYNTTAISDLIVRKQAAQLVSFLQKINPRVTDISTSGDLAYADIGLDQMVPLNVFGSGMIRAANIAASLLRGGEQILLVDELENGLHHAAVESFLRVLLALSHEKDVQIFATTHSVGVLESLLNVLGDDAFSEHRCAVRCFTLQRDRQGLVLPYRYEYEQFEHCVRHGIEIR